LVDDVEQIRSTCRAILEKKELLLESFNDSKKSPSELRAIINHFGIGFEDTDRILLRVLELADCSYDEFIDKLMVYVYGAKEEDSGPYQEFSSVWRLAK
jgi:hypothetical protein